jgi:two-component system sensor histidine kinase RstB
LVKLFFRLLFMSFTLLIVASLIGDFVTKQAYQSAYIEDLRRMHTTPAMLIKEELKSVACDQHTQKITQLQKLFGYPIALTKIQGSTLSPSQVQQLVEHQSYGEIDTNTLHYMMAECESYLSLGPIYAGTAQYLDDGQREAVGGFNLAEQQLKRLPLTQWADKIEQLNKDTFFPLVLLKLEAIELTASKLKRLNAGQIIYDENEGGEFVYKRITDTPWVIMADDVSQTDQWYYALLSELVYPFLLLAAIITTLLWVKPFWRDMQKIHKAINSFDNGVFSHKIGTDSAAQLKPLADSFNHLSTQVEQLIQGNKDLSNAVSHEFKTPLSNIAFSVALIREAEADPETHLLSIEDDVNQLNNLINEFLSYAKFQYAKPDLTVNTTTLAELTHGIKPKNDAQVLVNVVQDESRLEVECDLFYMQRALENVVSNARKYANTSIVIKFVCCELFFAIVVDDDGCGIEEQDKKRLLLPFERANTLENQNIKGSGFGLAIVNTVLSWHSGQVSIEDSPLGGARIKLQWPKLIT